MLIEGYRYGDTSRGMEKSNKGGGDYPVSLGFRNKEEFLHWITGKKVLDLGSGYGTLAKEVAKLGVDSKITSLNPSLADTEFRRALHAKTKEDLEIDDPELAEQINRTHDRDAVAATWDKLPFPDNSFDRVVSNFAFPMYVKSFQELASSLQEVKRVLAQGGEARFSAPMSNNIPGIAGNQHERRQKFYDQFTKILHKLDFSIKEISEFSEEMGHVVNQIGGGRLKTVDHPFCLSITKPTEVADVFIPPASRIIKPRSMYD